MKRVLWSMAVGLVLCAVAGWFIGQAQRDAPLPAASLPVCGESAEWPCYDDFGDAVQYDRAEVPIGATLYEDGSWVGPDGSSGCLKGGLCED